MNFLIVLENGSPRSGCQHGQVLGRVFVLACRRPLPQCVFTWQRRSSEVSVPLLRRALLLVDQSCTIMTSFNLNHPIKGLISRYSDFGVQSFNIGIQGGDTIQSILGADRGSLLGAPNNVHAPSLPWKLEYESIR